MRAVLLVLGIAILAIIVSVLVTPKKDLTADPMERQEEKRIAEEKKNAIANGARPPIASTPAPAFKPPREGVVTAVMTVKDRGTVVFEMYPKAAPKTVAQISKLIKDKFYDGILVHRVEPGFVVQFGNAATKTQGVDAKEGDSGVAAIPFEKNGLPNVEGSMSMALTAPASDTATSQMFINLKYNDFLDNSYCVFGKVTQGMDVVSKIQKGDVISSIVMK